MSSWSKKRKILYFILVLFILLIVIFIPAFLLFYRAPTCFDGVKNGKETGIDCGGGCSKLCASAFLSPSVSWTRFEQVAPNLYNIAAYIINPNSEGQAKNIPYKFSLYDNHGIPIDDYFGTVTLSPHRNSLAFSGAVSIKDRTPGKATFEFTSAPDWQKKTDPLSGLVITAKDYIEESSGSSLMVGLKNSGLKDLPKMTVYVVLYDGENNALGFSKTIIDSIAPDQTVTAPFTWPVDRHGGVVSIEVIPVSE